MSFMQAETTEKQYWLEVDRSAGLEYVPQDLFSVYEVRKILRRSKVENIEAGILALVGDYLEHRGDTGLLSVNLVKGYGVRSSAPGYMDCTSWSVYTTIREARKAARDEDRACKGED